MSWIRVIPDLSDYHITERKAWLCHYYDVVLLVEVLPLFVEVAHFLVQRLIEQFEIFQASLDTAGFLEPVLSCALM